MSEFLSENVLHSDGEYLAILRGFNNSCNFIKESKGGNNSANMVDDVQNEMRWPDLDDAQNEMHWPDWLLPSNIRSTSDYSEQNPIQVMVDSDVFLHLWFADDLQMISKDTWSYL